MKFPLHRASPYCLTIFVSFLRFPAQSHGRMVVQKPQTCDLMKCDKCVNRGLQHLECGSVSRRWRPFRCRIPSTGGSSPVDAKKKNW